MKKNCKPGLGDMAWRSEKKGKKKAKAKKKPEPDERETFYKAKGVKLE